MPTPTMVRAGSPNGVLASPDSALEQDAFRRFPYSLIVLDRKGRLTAVNLQGERLIEAMGLVGKELTCCTLLGCRSSESVLADTCLTELAHRHGHALPEVRVDLPTTEGMRAMWVTAAPCSTPAPPTWSFSCVPASPRTGAGAPIRTG